MTACSPKTSEVCQQFATTLFNAAFFGGLDFVQYQPHSIYIDRYPFGREATVSWPSVDLKLSNPTEYPVLIWTEYTPTSITVKLFGQPPRHGRNRPVRRVSHSMSAPGCGPNAPERGLMVVSRSIRSAPSISQARVLTATATQPCLHPSVKRTKGWSTATMTASATCVCRSRSSARSTRPLSMRTTDGLIDYCSAEECPEDTKAIDTDGDGNLRRMCHPRTL